MKKTKQDKPTILSPTYKVATDEQIKEFLEDPDAYEDDDNGKARLARSLRFPDTAVEITQN